MTLTRRQQIELMENAPARLEGYAARWRSRTVTTYTVFRDPANPIGRGLTACQAMDELLSTDDRSWQIVPDTAYGSGWILQTARQSYLSNRMFNVRGDVGHSGAETYDEARDEIAVRVLLAILWAQRPREWTDAEFMTDADFDVMLREAQEDRE